MMLLIIRTNPICDLMHITISNASEELGSQSFITYCRQLQKTRYEAPPIHLNALYGIGIFSDNSHNIGANRTTDIKVIWNENPVYASFHAAPVLMRKNAIMRSKR